MYHCIPRGLCSWDFDITGDGHSAGVEINWLGEQGILTIDGEHHDVRKQGYFSGHWLLEANSTKVATAQKSNPMTRTIELGTFAGMVVLSAQSAFGRTMLLEGAGFAGVITPVHPLTRRATITGRIPDFRTACFAFWLTVLLWRRTAQSNSS